MSIVSIGEVIGSVHGGDSEPARPPSEQPPKDEQGASPLPAQLESVERELRARARRRARLQAD